MYGIARGERRHPAAGTPGREEEMEVVQVEDDANEGARASEPQPESENITLEAALALWRNILDYEHELNALGYPQYVLDRVADTAVEWTRHDHVSCASATAEFGVCPG